MLKRFFLVMAVLATVFTSSAEFRWGPKAEFNITDYSFKQDLVDVNSGIGFNAGVVGELMFPGIGFGVDFGLQYSLHGAKVNLGEKNVWAVDGYGNEPVKIHSLQIPIHLRYKYSNLQGAERYVAPFAFVGPVFSFHLADNNLKAMEYPAGTVSIQFGLGAELFEDFQVFGSYNLGVSYEMRTVKLDNFSARPSAWTVGLTYLF